MDDTHDDRTLRQLLGSGMFLLATCVVAELLYFPSLAGFLHRLFAGHGWDGSGLVYYQWFVFAPAVLVFSLLAAVLIPLMAARSLRHGLITLAVLSLLHFFLLGFVVHAYSRAVTAHKRQSDSTRTSPFAIRGAGPGQHVASGAFRLSR